MIKNLWGVKLDGSVPPAPQVARCQTRQHVWWPLALGGTIHLTLVNEAGVVVDMTGAKLRVTIRRNAEDEDPLICREGSLGSTDIDLPASAFAAAKEASYRYDIVLIDDADVWWQVVPTFTWSFMESVSSPDDTAPIPP